MTIKKIEYLLYNYPSFFRMIEQEKIEIENIMLYGVPRNSDGESSGRTNSYSGLEDMIIKKEMAIYRCQQNINKAQENIDEVNNMIKVIERDRYKDIIPLYYFSCQTYRWIALRLNCDWRTVKNNKQRLINKIYKHYEDERYNIC